MYIGVYANAGRRPIVEPTRSVSSGSKWDTEVMARKYVLTNTNTVATWQLAQPLAKASVVHRLASSSNANVIDHLEKIAHLLFHNMPGVDWWMTTMYGSGTAALIYAPSYELFASDSNDCGPDPVPSHLRWDWLESAALAARRSESLRHDYVAYIGEQLSLVESTVIRLAAEHK
eukprot:COSAG02_NODE_17392_length_1007_cov_1.333700_1_plen_173_part_10